MCPQSPPSVFDQCCLSSSSMFVVLKMFRKCAPTSGRLLSGVLAKESRRSLTHLKLQVSCSGTAVVYSFRIGIR